MNIGFFTDTYVPQVNGVVSSIVALKQELEKQNHKVYIFAPSVPGYKDNFKEKARIFRFRSFKFLFQPEYRVAQPLCWKFLRQISKIKLDIIHAHTPFSLGVLALLISYLQNRPLVYTHHTFYHEYVKIYLWKGRLFPPKAAKKITTAFCNKCNAIIAPSLRVKHLLKKDGVKKKILELPSGISFQNFAQPIKSNDFRRKHGISDKANVLIFVGRIAKEKNIEFLISVFEKISQELDDVYFVLVGDGIYRAKLNLFAEKIGSRKNIIFTGYLQGSELIKSYQTADIFIYSSKTETQGLVVLEAAASGLPIVALKDLAFKNILIDSFNGYLVADESVEDFSQKVIKILKNSKMSEKMSQNSKALAQKFSVSNQTNKLVALYQSLM